MLGFWQEFKAEKAMEALKKMAHPNTRVRREANEKTLSAKELVPGDIIIIEKGNLIPADARIITSTNLKVQEAALTGESEPVTKTSDILTAKNISLADRNNMLHMGTIVTYGRGEAVVTDTGMNTELGHIAEMLQDVVDEKTPLQKRLAKVGIKIAYFVLILIGIVSVLGYFQGNEIKQIFMTAISLAVAAIPEGLPAVVTIALALGAREMLKRNALIRNLPAVETLGSVTVICSDKTGTLTKNEMIITDIILVNHSQSMDKIISESQRNPVSQLALLCGALCNDAVVSESDEHASFKAIGDPTEGALVIAAEKASLIKKDIESFMPRVAEYPFDSERKRMSTLHTITTIPEVLRPAFDLILPKTNSGKILWTKGSVDGLIDISTHVLVDTEIVALSNELKEKILKENENQASQGVRVLAMAYRFVDNENLENVSKEEQGLVFIGMSCMMDPVRSEAIEAVKECKKAGVRVVMITGDHPLTACAIGKKIGLTDQGKYLTGRQLSKMSNDELKDCIHDVSIFARVSPEHKMVIIDALQAEGQIVSMTGDGVNDAPALKSANIGIAMGITGTDVSKEASDMVLLDDNFATIVAAVKYGRKIFDNIRKFIQYILTGNMGEIIVMLVGPFLGIPLPLLPIQILWINLVTDGAPAVALGYEHCEADVMGRPPFKPKEGIFSRGIGTNILVMGTIIGLLSIAVGYIFWIDSPLSGAWQTMIFSTIAFCQLGLAMTIRRTKETIFSREFFSNRPILIAVVITFILQLGIIYTPFCNKIFKTESLTFLQFCVCLGAGFFIMILAEAQKLFNKIVKRNINEK